MNSDQAQSFVEANAVLITDANKFARCVDGRYENITDCPMIAKPGGDAGDVMALYGALNILGKNLPMETPLNLVIENVNGTEHFNFHTDDKANPTDVGLGCGHVKQAKLDPDAYGLTAEQINFLVEQLPSLLEKGAHQEVLHGDHAEQAVIVVDSETHGVMPLLRDGENVSEAFIYQKTLHSQQLDQLSKSLQEAIAAQGEVVEESEIRKALNDSFGKQLSETLKRLANGLPIFTAAINESGSVKIQE